MTDHTPIEDQAMAIAEQHQRIQERRITVTAIIFFVLLLFVSVWLALALGLAVRVFRLAAGI